MSFKQKLSREPLSQTITMFAGHIYDLYFLHNDHELLKPLPTVDILHLI